jgi:DNA-binding NtrC family response regulator
MKGRVLIVDDEPVILECLGAIMSAETLDVRTAGSAHAAVAEMREGPFDLVITDMAMETETAGWNVVRAAQQQSYRPEVVILTAFHIPAAEWKGRGVKELFTKGQESPGTMMLAVRRILDEGIRRRTSSANGQKLRA